MARATRSRCNATEALPAKSTPECFSHGADLKDCSHFLFCLHNAETIHCIMREWPLSCKKHVRLRYTPERCSHRNYSAWGQCLLRLRKTLVFFCEIPAKTTRGCGFLWWGGRGGGSPELVICRIDWCVTQNYSCHVQMTILYLCRKPPRDVLFLFLFLFFAGSASASVATHHVQSCLFAELTGVSQNNTPDVPKWLYIYAENHFRGAFCMQFIWSDFVWRVNGGVFSASRECFSRNAKTNPE